MQTKFKRCLRESPRGRAAAMALAGAAAVLLFAAGSAYAAFDAYMKFPGIAGTSDASHAGWVGVSRVMSGNLSQQVAADREGSQPSVSELAVRKAGGNPSQAAGRPGGAPAPMMAMPTGRRSYQPFLIRRRIDAASPMLSKACASGQHFSSVEVDEMSNGRMTHYILSDVTIVSDVKAGGTPPMEEISLNFTKITWK